MSISTLQSSSTTPTKLSTLTKKKCVVTHAPFLLNLLCAPAYTKSSTFSKKLMHFVTFVDKKYNQKSIYK